MKVRASLKKRSEDCKIVRRKGPALSGLKTLNMDGAIIAVWKRITPQIKPDNNICKLINIFIFYII